MEDNKNMTKQNNEKEPTGLPVTVPTCTAKDTAGNEVTGYYVLLHIPETDGDGHGTVTGYRSVPSIFCDTPGNREGNHWHTIDPSTLRMDNTVQIPATSDALVLLDYLLAVINDSTEEITTTTNGQDSLVVANTKNLLLLFNQADCEALKTVGGEFAMRILDQMEKGGNQ